MIPQAEINKEFTKFMAQESWESRDQIMRNFVYSGYRILDKIGPDDSILDIGCGRNLFKSHRPNVLGIDPVHDDADIKVAFQDFETTEKFDVILGLGSLHFGDLEDIVSLTEKLTGMLNPGGKVFWRCSARSDAWFQYAWTKQLHHDLADRFGYAVVELEDDYLIGGENKLPLKIYSQWVKNL
jgi:2-polyprenyl-3-methyl-5-hydroxy-6-metoxy-1,4-benzoquinol methylase